ncbi:MAG TPA: VCBS repeat-containing protein, partial [Cyclobacteriaceae bacterium]
VALGDINNDGLLDIYFTSNSYENKLYLNKGNLKFEDISARSNTICEAGWKTGACMADVNNDGWLDIYLCKSGDSDPNKRKNILLINNKDLTFSDQAHNYGLDDDSYSTQAAFFDFDRDGDLDLFLLNHSLLQISNAFDITNKNSTVRFAHVGNKFYRNDLGHFTDVSDSVGVFGPASNYGLGVSISDFNNDGWPDLYSGSDYTGRDRLLINNHGTIFNDSIYEMLSHTSKFTMGTDAADINNDGLSDLITLDMLPEDNKRQKLLLGADKYNVFNQMVESGLHSQYMRNMLHLNMGNGSLSEIGQLAGISDTDWSWAPLIADFDNDGNPDIFISNGFKRDLTNSDFAKYHAHQEIEKARTEGKQISKLELIEKFHENKIHNYIFQGNGDLTFTNKVVDWGFVEPTLSNGAAYGDLDNDGDLDLVMNELNDVAAVYENHSNTHTNNHFLRIKLQCLRQNKEGIGARVNVYAGGQLHMKEQFPVRGFQSSVDPTLHFGLGKADRIDSVIVRWPNGLIQKKTNIKADQLLVIQEEKNLKPIKPDNVVSYFSKSTSIIDFKHHENTFVDFDVQSLLPREYSTMGPALALGDVNGDGLKDVYIGGAKGQTSVLFLKNNTGTLKQMIQPAFEIDKESEDVDAVFFDADNDKDLDLYVVSGGYEFQKDDPLLQDRLYMNDGNGKMTKTSLPLEAISGSCVRPSDFDRDGDTDLFIGGRISPGRYPEIPESQILVNDGKGHFTTAKLDELKSRGMVTDACWVDLNHDGMDDLIVVGEWMTPEILINSHGKFKRATKDYIHKPMEGWWNCITANDMDGDGDIDFMLGNAGLNNQVKANREHPATLVYDDFDKNGSIDPILCYYIQGKSFPYASRDELLEQLPSFRKRFTNYESYSDATIDNILTSEEISHSKKLSMVEMRSCYLRNDGDSLMSIPMPVEMQIAPVFALAVTDINGDGKQDIITGGNLSATRSRTGKMTGNTGFVFLGDGKGNFSFVSPMQTALRCIGDVRKLIFDNDRIFIANNNAGVQCYILNKKPSNE